MLVGGDGFPRDRRLRRPGGSGRDRRDRRRRDRRSGRDPAHSPDRAGVDLRDPRRHHELLHRPQAGARLPREARPASQHHPRALGAGGRATSSATAARRSWSAASSAWYAPSPPSSPAPRRWPFATSFPTASSGTGFWATTFCVLGYVFWRSFDRVVDIAGRAIFGFGLAVAVIVGAVVVYRRRSRDLGLAARARAPSAAAAAVRRRPIAASARDRPAGPGARPRGPLPRASACPPAGSGSSSPPRWPWAAWASTCSCSTPSSSPATWVRLRSTESCSTWRIGCATSAGVTAAKIVSGFGSFPACAALVLVTAVVLAVPAPAAPRSSRWYWASGSSTWRCRWPRRESTGLVPRAR